MQVSYVVDACCLFLEKQLDPTNAIGIANFAEQHCCTNLYQKANEYIVQHFNQICKEEEFLQLSAMQLSMYSLISPVSNFTIYILNTLNNLFCSKSCKKRRTQCTRRT